MSDYIHSEETYKGWHIYIVSRWPYFHGIAQQGSITYYTGIMESVEKVEQDLKTKIDGKGEN